MLVPFRAYHRDFCVEPVTFPIVVIIDTLDLQKRQLYHAMHSTEKLTTRRTHPMRLHVDEVTLCRQDPTTSVA